MPSKRRPLKRAYGNRSYLKMFVIAVEGKKTEKEYFQIFNKLQSIVRVKCLEKKNKSAATQTLKKMRTYLKDENLQKKDEAWLVVDKDSNSNKDLDELFAWSQQKENFGLALSNPQFEYWLLLHFEDGTGIRSVEDCNRRLKSHLPNYNKGIDARKFPLSKIRDAIKFAKQKDVPKCKSWPRKFGCTTVYRLIENIIEK